MVMERVPSGCPLASSGKGLDVLKELPKLEGWRATYQIAAHMRPRRIFGWQTLESLSGLPATSQTWFLHLGLA